MALSYPVLKLPTAPETKAFRAVQTILQSDPLLKATVRAWRVWDGSSEDILNPTYSTCPYLGISPQPEASDRATEMQHLAPLNVSIRLAIAGSNVDQLANFWAAVRSALFPVDPTRHATVLTLAQQAGISRSVLTAGGYGVQMDAKDPGLRMLIAMGQLRLVMLVTTP